MAKGNPIRVEQGLMGAAKRSGARLRRSAAQQIEHWADIGRRFEGIVSHDVLADVITGQVRVVFEKSVAAPIDSKALFVELDQNRASGDLGSRVSEASVRYQASESSPGMLERIDAGGEVTIGQFSDGRFVASNDTAELASQAQRQAPQADKD